MAEKDTSRLLAPRSHGPVIRGRTFFTGGSWDAGSNPTVATTFFFFFFMVFLPSGFLLLILTADPVSFARFLLKRIANKFINESFAFSPG